ncbi:UNVERIFIED_ORG: aspartate/methionine/tyrosine aminotransferase [Gordonia westfalica J30]
MQFFRISKGYRTCSMPDHAHPLLGRYNEESLTVSTDAHLAPRPSPRFAHLGIETAPGQEARHSTPAPHGVDFSHGDVNAFPPPDATIDEVERAYADGGRSAYSTYRGHSDIRASLAPLLAEFTESPVNPDNELILTPGTQAGLFLALSSLVEVGDKVAVVEPDYFANRKIVKYLGGQMVPVGLHYASAGTAAQLDLRQLERAFIDGARIVVFSNPNNPTGILYTHDQINAIASLVDKYNAFAVVDELYSRLIYPPHTVTHLRGTGIPTERVITLLGPSKTESLSGFRLGAAIGSPPVIERMEKLLAIVSLRASGYNQSALNVWFREPTGWLDRRIDEHRRIRDDLVRTFDPSSGFEIRATEGGSYIFPRLPRLRISPERFRHELKATHGITVTPGTEFGPTFVDSIRLNFSQHHAPAIDAARAIVKLAQEYRT